MGRKALPERGAGCHPRGMDSSTTYDLRQLTASAIERGDHASAADMIATMFAMNPNDANAHRQWARLLLAREDVDSAVESMRQAAELAPLDPSMRVELAQLLIRRAGREHTHFRDRTWKAARAEAHRALAIQSNHEGAHRLIDWIDEQRLVDSITTADHTPHVMLERTTPARQFKMPNTTSRMANNHAILWAVAVLVLFSLLVLRLT